MNTTESTTALEMQAAWRALSKQITLSLTFIWKIDHGKLVGHDRGAFVGSISRTVERLAANGEAAMVDKAMELVEAYNRSQSIPAIPEGHRFWTFPALARDERARAGLALMLGPEIVAQTGDAKVVADLSADSVTIKFARKPKDEILRRLRDEAWEYSRDTFAWGRKYGDAAKQSAKRIVGIQ